MRLFAQLVVCNEVWKVKINAKKQNGSFVDSLRKNKETSSNV